MPQAFGRIESVSSDLAVGDVSARGLSWVWPLGVVAAVIYGSILPFDFDWASFNLSQGLAPLWERTAVHFLEDIVTNLLVYVPVGAVVAL